MAAGYFEERGGIFFRWKGVVEQTRDVGVPAGLTRAVMIDKRDVRGEVEIEPPTSR